MESLELPIVDLDLDLKNPRLGEVGSEPEALAAIILLEPDHFKNMMTSIRDHGLDPGDSFYIISESEESTYTVVDGNRRLAALKVLRNPELLKRLGLSQGIVKSILNTAKGFDKKKIVNLRCVLFESRDRADEWILRRHGRGLDGEGRISWGPLEIDRFKKDGSIIDIIDFIDRHTDHSEASSARKDLQRSSSTLRRLVESKKGRDWLGLSIVEDASRKVPHFTLDPEIALKFLRTLVEDIKTNKINTRKLNSTEEIEKYFNSLPAEAKPDGAVYGVSQSFRDAKVSRVGNKKPEPSKASNANKDKTKTTRVPGPRTTLAPQRHKFGLPAAEKGQQLLREASKLKLEEVPLACAFVLRAFIEHTIDTYMTTHKIPFWENSNQLDLPKRADRVIDHLVKSGTPMKHLQGVRTILTSKSDPASIKNLNNYHHDHYQVPGVDVLRNAWDAAEPLYVAVYGNA